VGVLARTLGAAVTVSTVAALPRNWRRDKVVMGGYSGVQGEGLREEVRAARRGALQHIFTIGIPRALNCPGCDATWLAFDITPHWRCCAVCMMPE
jgi:hypothetical protein